MKQDDVFVTHSDGSSVIPFRGAQSSCGSGAAAFGCWVIWKLFQREISLSAALGWCSDEKLEAGHPLLISDKPERPAESA